MPIHKSAIIAPSANIGTNVSIGPFAIIEDNTTIGNDCNIAAHAVIRAGTTLGSNVTVDSFAVIGGNPQDTSFDPKTPTGVYVGKNTTIRESVTINRATIADTNTEIGENCLLFACSHVAHDCKVGHKVQINNGVLLGGHVTIGSFAYLGGNSVYHQNINIGEGVIIAGRAGINLDIPPFLMVSEHNHVHGLNLIGLKRRGFFGDTVSELKETFTAVLNTSGSPYNNASNARSTGLGQTELASTFLDFFSTRGKKGCVNYTHVQFRK